MSDPIGLAADTLPLQLRWRHGALTVLLLLGTICALDSFVISAMITPVKSALGLSDQALGAVMSSTTVAGIIGAPIFGVLASRYPRRIILVLAAAFWSLASAGGAFAAGVGTLVIWRALTGFGAAAYNALAPGWLADLYDKRSRSVVFALFMLRNKLGSALAFSVGAWLAAAYDWHIAFLATGLPGLLLAVAVLALQEPRPGEADGQTAQLRKPRLAEQLQIIRIRPFRIHLFATIFFFAGTATAQLWLPAFLHRVYGISNQAASGYLSVVLMGTLPIGILGGWVTGKFLSRRRGGVAASLAITSLLAALFFAVTFTTRDLGLAKVFGAAAIACFGSTAGNLTLLAVETVPASARSFAGSLAALISTGVSGAIAPWLLGLLSDRFGLANAIYLGAAAYFIAGLIWVLAVQQDRALPLKDLAS